MTKQASYYRVRPSVASYEEIENLLEEYSDFSRQKDEKSKEFLFIHEQATIIAFETDRSYTDLIIRTVSRKLPKELAYLISTLRAECVEKSNSSNDKSSMEELIEKHFDLNKIGR